MNAERAKRERDSAKPQRWNIKRKIAWIETQLIRQALAGSSTRKAARQLLGLSAQGFQNKLRRYKLGPIAKREYPICSRCGRAGKPRPSP